MRADIKPIFGEIPVPSDNLEIVGEFPRRIEHLDNAIVWPGSGVVCRPDGQVENQSVWVPANLRYCHDYHSKWSFFPRRKKGSYFNLSLFWWSNYYHWHCDILTRLIFILPHLPAGTQVILPRGLSKLQRVSLEMVGLDLDRCVEYNGRRPWKVDELIWTAPLAMTGDHEASTLQLLRETLFQQSGMAVPKSPGNRRLYLTRKNTRGREVVNEEEVLAILLTRGFESVDCSTLDYRQQMEVVSQAGWIVAPHGAALTNLLWCAPGTSVFEIFEPCTVRRCYWSLSRALDFRYHCAIAETRNRVGGEADMVVDSEKFSLALDQIGL